MLPTRAEFNYTKLLQCLIILTLLLPVRIEKAQAETNDIQYQKSWEITAPENVATADREFVDTSWAAIQAELAKPKPKVAARSDGYCSCVTYLEKQFPQISGIGWGNNWPVNAQTGVVRAVVVFKYPHVGKIIGVAATGWILDEANYVHCKHTNDRILPFDDPSIKGFWIP